MQVKRVEKTEKIKSVINRHRRRPYFHRYGRIGMGETRGKPRRGELCVNSIDCDGTHSGYDLDITGLIADHVSIPVIASGGAGNPSHIADAFLKTGASAAIISSMLYSPKLPRNYPVAEIKEYLLAQGIPVRPYLK